MKFLISCVLCIFSLGNVYAEGSMVKKPISNESEFSLIQSGGNSSVETYNAKTLSKLESKKRTYSLSGHYTVSFYESIDSDGDSFKSESARNWDIKGKYEQILSSDLSGFAALQYEGDEFSGFKQRDNVDIGGMHNLISTKKMQSSFELGMRYTTEKNVQRDFDNKDLFYYTKGRLYFELDQIISEALTWKFWIEYLPNFSDGDDYIVSYEPSISFFLSSTFSLKTAYKAIYDNKPNLEGNDKKDYKLTTSLVARF